MPKNITNGISLFVHIKQYFFSVETQDIIYSLTCFSFFPFKQIKKTHSLVYLEQENGESIILRNFSKIFFPGTEKENTFHFFLSREKCILMSYCEHKRISRCRCYNFEHEFSCSPSEHCQNSKHGLTNSLSFLA